MYKQSRVAARTAAGGQPNPSCRPKCASRTEPLQVEVRHESMKTDGFQLVLGDRRVAPSRVARQACSVAPLGRNCSPFWAARAVGAAEQPCRATELGATGRHCPACLNGATGLLCHATGPGRGPPRPLVISLVTPMHVARQGGPRHRLRGTGPARLASVAPLSRCMHWHDKGY